MGASNNDDETSTTNNNSAIVVKAAKKTLKRQESGSMKMKHLTKTLLTKFESNDSIPSCKNTVKKWIEESNVFDVDGKVVTLKKGSSSSKKRKSISSSVEEEEDADNNNGSGDNIDKKAAKKAAKKAKKDKKKSSSTTTTPANNTAESNISAWRTQNKIVLKDARNDIDGANITKSLASNATYYPYQTFQDVSCIDKIHEKLIHQCTVVNGFVKPSPIQAQCWVSYNKQLYSLH